MSALNPGAGMTGGDFSGAIKATIARPAGGQTMAATKAATAPPAISGTISSAVPATIAAAIGSAASNGRYSDAANLATRVVLGQETSVVACRPAEVTTDRLPHSDARRRPVAVLADDPAIRSSEAMMRTLGVAAPGRGRHEAEPLGELSVAEERFPAAASIASWSP